MSTEEAAEGAAKYTAFLKRVFFFKDLAEGEFTEISHLCGEERFSAGEVIFVEGAVADKFYIVMTGKVEVWKAYRDERRSLLAVHGAGHFFGEMALIDDLPRSATLVAREPTQALYILREDFQRLIRSNASIALSVMMSISLMVRSSNETFVEDLRERNAKLEAAYSELKAAQDELVRAERLSTIGKFSSLILHDIRNPIAVMKAIADLASLHSGDAVAVAGDLKRMRAEIARMERLAQEFLDYTRGEIRLSLGVATVDAVFTRLTEGLGDKLQRSSIELELVNQAPEPFVVDEERFSRVLVNLAENSRKAMPHGGTLSIRAHRRGDRVVFTVMDSGEGMTQEVLDRIFEPFYSNSGKGGTGLGMLIVKNIVEAHEGDIEVRSQPEKGTEVIVSIPARI
jgi:signal transduction histidine kinase